MKLLFLFLTKHFIYQLSLSLSHSRIRSANMPSFHFFLFWFLASHITISLSADTLTSTRILLTNQTLVSPSQVFALGFFSGTNSKLYLGIWYNNIDDNTTVVWVANRDNPLENSTGFLKIGDNGNIVLLTNNNPSGNTVWSSNETKANNPVLQLLDTGNLVVREANVTDQYLWQSFDYPTDTLLPGMKMGWNLDTGVEKHLTSWKNTGSDPSSGDCSFKIDTRGLPEIFLRNGDQNITYRSGPWNGQRFSGVPEMQPDTDSITFNFSYDQHGVYYSFSIGNRSILSRLIVTSDGVLQRLTWVPSSKTWTRFWYAPKDQCDDYEECGPYGVCDSNASPVCTCMRGFRPKNQQAWNLRDGSDGCVRNHDLDCGSDGFLHVPNVKLPETTNVFANRSMSLGECEVLCRRNCSCKAYANIEITDGGTGCVTWSDELMDMRLYSEGGGQDLYVRLAASDVDDTGSASGSHKTNHTGEVVGITISAAVIILGLGVIFWKKRKLLSISKLKTAPRGSVPPYNVNVNYMV
ncbi:Receptor serine/threonine-protein kinase SD1-8 [Spatholobus suberectus]|nr:Receptor serine/threonine-protein kinase SD1-8 [Spatholobus suberectus]